MMTMISVSKKNEFYSKFTIILITEKFVKILIKLELEKINPENARYIGREGG